MLIPEIRDVRLDDSFVRALQRLVERLQPHFGWRSFSRVPQARLPGSPVQQLRDLVAIELLGRHGFLARASSHELSRAMAEWREGRRAMRLFDLLCLNLAVDERELSFALSGADIDGFIADGVLFRRGSTVMLPVSLVPYADRWYVGESWYLKAHVEDYGTQGAPVGFDTWLQIEYLRRRVGERPVDRMLEVGPGTGIVLIESRALARRREGAEYDARTLAFAQANVRLHADSDGRVFASDLLSGATGLYDLIVFNPWQPSEAHFTLIERFLRESVGHLSEHGAISLLLNTPRVGRRDPLMESLSVILAELGLVAARDIVHTFSAAGNDGASVLRSQHFSWITRAPGISRAGANITDDRSLSWAMLEGRSWLTARRG